MIKKELLYKMMLIRALEERISKEYHLGEMRCPVHLSIGQEASAVGVCVALDKKDIVLSTHRSHAHYLAKGGSEKKMIAELFGKSSGCCGGRGGSMHLCDFDVNMLGSVPIVGSSIPLATGCAFHFKKNKIKNTVIVFVGDASLEEGAFYESANFASLHNLPIIFACENNLYSVYTKLKDRQPHDKLTSYSKAHGINSFKINGNDVEKIYKLTNKLRQKCLSGKGPFFIQMDTYRWLEHCGPNYDNSIGYRTEKEFKLWKKKCPVKHYTNKLLKNNYINKNNLEIIDRDINKKVDNAFNYARKSTFPKVNSVNKYVYS